MDNPYEPKLVEPVPQKPIVIPFSEKHLITHCIWFHGSFAAALVVGAMMEYGPLRTLWLLLTQAPSFLLTCINGLILWMPHGLLVTLHAKSRALDARLSAIVGISALFAPLLVHTLLTSAGLLTTGTISWLIMAPGCLLFSLLMVVLVALMKRRSRQA